MRRDRENQREPGCFQARVPDLDPVRVSPYRPAARDLPHREAGHTTAPDRMTRTGQKPLASREASTHGSPCGRPGRHILFESGEGNRHRCGGCRPSPNPSPKGGGFGRCSFRRGIPKGKRVPANFLQNGAGAVRVGKTGQPSVFGSLFAWKRIVNDRARIKDNYPVSETFAAQTAGRYGSPMFPKAARGGALRAAPRRPGGPARQFFAKERPVCLDQGNGPSPCFSGPFAEIE